MVGITPAKRNYKWSSLFQDFLEPSNKMLSICKSTEPLSPEYDCGNLIGTKATYRPFAINTLVRRPHA